MVLNMENSLIMSTSFNRTIIDGDDDTLVNPGETLQLEIAQEENKEIGQVILDIALADDLKTEFQLVNVLNSDKESVSHLITSELCHFGASDAGAHITQFCGTGDTTHLLEHYVRETQKMSLSTAIFRICQETLTNVQLDNFFNDLKLKSNQQIIDGLSINEIATVPKSAVSSFV